MKFLEKVKNMFTEEVEEEVTPIKTEVRKVEIPAPKPPVKEEVIEENTSVIDTDSNKKEEKFKFPVYFDDKDFDELKTPEEKKEEKKVEKAPKIPPKEPVRKEAYGGKNPAFSASVKKEDKRTFRPTPIISPVYGVLDKNYRKDDIAPKKRIIEQKPSKELTVDDIRNKAFGPLEEDLETTLFGKNSVLFNNEIDNDESIDLFDELDIKVEEPKEIPSRVEKNKELELMDEVDDLDQILIADSPIETIEPEKEDFISEKEMTNMIEDEMDKICSEPADDLELTESDLFSLIDSMYEKKDGEE